MAATSLLTVLLSFSPFMSIKFALYIKCSYVVYLRQSQVGVSCVNQFNTDSDLAPVLGLKILSRSSGGHTDQPLPAWELGTL